MKATDDHGTNSACRHCRNHRHDQILRAADKGWGVTVRYAILAAVVRWPAVAWGAGGTGGALALLGAYARSRGWL